MKAGFATFSGTANRPLASAIAAELGVQLGACAIDRYPDGEVSVELLEPVRRKEVLLVQAWEVANRLASGIWTHDFPITAEAASDLIGLPVSTAMPQEVYRLMSLYRQPDQGQSSVVYLPGASLQKERGGDGSEVRFRLTY